MFLFVTVRVLPLLLSILGYLSYRRRNEGSWFVQAFYEVFMRDGRRLELVQLLTRVNRMVSYEYHSQSADADKDKKKQSPCIMSMLTKSFYFS